MFNVSTLLGISINRMEGANAVSIDPRNKAGNGVLEVVEAQNLANIILCFEEAKSPYLDDLE